MSGTDYAQFILDELTNLTGYNKQHLDNVLKVNVGDLKVKGVWSWHLEEYPTRIEFEYGVKVPNWYRFRDSVKNNNEIVKKYKIRDEKQYQITKLIQEGPQENSILLEVEFMGDARKFGHNTNMNDRLSATVVGTTEESMVNGIETVMDLSVPFEVKVTPFMKTPKSAFDYYGKFNMRKEVNKLLA